MLALPQGPGGSDRHYQVNLSLQSRRFVEAAPSPETTFKTSSATSIRRRLLSPFVDSMQIGCSAAALHKSTSRKVHFLAFGARPSPNSGQVFAVTCSPMRLSYTTQIHFVQTVASSHIPRPTCSYALLTRRLARRSIFGPTRHTPRTFSLAFLALHTFHLFLLLLLLFFLAL